MKFSFPPNVGSGMSWVMCLKALSYYEDGNLPTVPESIRLRLVEAVRNVDLDRLPMLEREV